MTRNSPKPKRRSGPRSHRFPSDKRMIITSHDAFGYFEHEYGLTFLAPEGISTEAEASAADVAALIRQLREDNASAIFVENITNPRLIEQIARETGLTVGGTLYSDALSEADGRRKHLYRSDASQCPHHQGRNFGKLTSFGGRSRPATRVVTSGGSIVSRNRKRRAAAPAHGAARDNTRTAPERAGTSRQEG